MPCETSPRLIIYNAMVSRPLCLHNYWTNAGIRVQSLKKGQIIMDIDFRWGGDPSIILAVEAALVASIPIQVGELFPFCPVVSMLGYHFKSLHTRNLKFVIMILSIAEGSSSFHCCSCHLPTCRRDTLYFCCCCCSTFWGKLLKCLEAFHISA